MARPRVILSYVFDWVVIIIIAAIAAGISKVEPNHRPFSLVDQSISFPYVEHQKVSTTVLFVVSLVAPAIIITFVSLVFVPGPTGHKLSFSSQSITRKLWEWNVGWMGLALGCAVTALFTNGLKLLIGNPRPDLLSRCNPKLSEASSYVLGGFNNQVSDGALVSWTICQQTDRGILADGFQSFPSGHSSFAFAGFFYLALFLCSKFAIRIPYLLREVPTHSNISSSAYSANGPSDSGDSANTSKELHTTPSRSESARIHRDEAAAPPTYLLALPLIPLCAATYIAATRFSDFRHHPFDILFGAVLGIVVSWASFRMYQLPVRRGDGWAWRSRSASKAFGVPIGASGYVEDCLQSKRSDDVESGRTHVASGRHPFPSESENGKSVQQDV